MDRESWTSLPAATREERDLLAAMNGFSARRELLVVAADGGRRALAADLSVEAAEPFDGKADVVVRLVLEGAGPGAGDRFVMDPWDLLDQFLRESRADAETRRRSSAAR
jgi:hypothetical protein